MSLKMEFHLKWNATQTVWNVTQNGRSLKMECQANGLSLKKVYH